MVLNAINSSHHSKMTSSLTERIIPITILDDDDEKDIKIKQIRQKVKDGNSEGIGSERKESLLLTLDDGTTTKIDGTVTKLGSVNSCKNDSSSQSTSSQSGSLRIEEIGQETLKREIRERSDSAEKKAGNSNPKPEADKTTRDKFLFGEHQQKTTAGNSNGKAGKKPSSENDSDNSSPTKTKKKTTFWTSHNPDNKTNSTHNKTPTTETHNLPPKPQEKPPPQLPSSKNHPPESPTKTEESTNKIRFVPINLSDGRVLQRDPDETMEIKTEFTNYCHQEFNNSSPTSSTTNKSTTTSNKQRIVPITLDNGEKFMPTFTQLHDLEPPDWSAFSPKNRERITETNLIKETVVPIRLENQFRSSSSREESPVRTSRRTTTRSSREKMTKSHEKRRVQHSVRFVDDDDENDEESEEKNRRSSSLDGRARFRQTGNGRDRHRSGGHVTSGPSGASSVSGEKEKTLHEIDRDINKIWRELQELDTVALQPRQAHSAHNSAKATPVKIRTFTTPIPASINSNSSSRTSSPRTIFDEDIVISGLPPQPSSSRSYNPRRDKLEPTKPGSITPIVTPVYVTTPSRQQVKLGEANNRPAATVLQMQVGQDSHDGVNNNNGVEFYPRFEMRPRAESLVRREKEEEERKKIQENVVVKSSPVESSLESCADKACQTEGEEGRKRRKNGKCSIQ